MCPKTQYFGGFLKLLIGKFSINGDRGILIPKDKTIDIKYIQFVLQPILREVAKGRKGENNKNEFTKVSLTAIQEVEIPFPIKKDGTIDLEKQKEISEKYEKIEKIKIKTSKILCLVFLKFITDKITTTATESLKIKIVSLKPKKFAKKASV